MDEFTIKDSGERLLFDSGMQRDTQADKTLWSLIYSGPMLERWAEHLTAGAVKYGPNNWLLAEGEAELQRFRDSAARHFAQWMRGDRDEDHAAAVFFNLNGAEYVLDKMRAASEYNDVLDRAFEALWPAPVPGEDWDREPSEGEGMPSFGEYLDRLEVTRELLPPATSPELELVGGPDLDDAEAWLKGMLDAGQLVIVGVDDEGEPLYGIPVESKMADHKCECSPAVYALAVTQEGPLKGRRVLGTYSDCNDEWYTWPPGVDPRSSSMVYEIPKDGVELIEKVAESVEALLDTP